MAEGLVQKGTGERVSPAARKLGRVLGEVGGKAVLRNEGSGREEGSKARWVPKDWVGIMSGSEGRDCRDSALPRGREVGRKADGKICRIGLESKENQKSGRGAARTPPPAPEISRACRPYRFFHSPM